ncbi:MAG: type VII toxin-antitoxin system HepT family RNase toxin [Candidatus Helarchaeota archaeon]
MFDQEGITDHIIELEQAIDDWKRYQKIKLDELKTDRDKKNMVLHALLVSIQAAIDIANHLIASNKLPRPSTYRESFDILAEAKFLSSNLANQLADLAGFRNLLVHVYWRLDMELVYNILKNDLDTLTEFIRVIKDTCKEH